MRILMVAEQYPWPATDGYRRRMDHIVRGLVRLGTVEVLALHRPGTAEPVDPGIPGVTVNPVPVGGDAGLRDWLPRWIRSDAPRRMFGPDWGSARDELASMGSERSEGPRFDVVWFSHVDSWWALGDDVEASAVVVDFDNLENLAMRLRRRIPPRVAPGASLGERAGVLLRWTLSRAFDLVDERRWNRLQQRCSSAVDAVVVCSDLDVERSGCDNAVVIGNGADRPDQVSVDRKALRAGAPTMLFVGALDYEPNTEAIEWFVRDVFQRIRDRVPDAVVRIVGRGRDAVSWVDSVDGVEVVGHVPEVQPELDRADVSIVPIRVGAGTRLKVVEALANHLPMVTTTVGCEGIDVIDGVHALIADDSEDFAIACARLLEDGSLRQSLADRGAELFASSYDWTAIEERLAVLVGDLAARR